jgi:hypothetical protein
MLNNHEKSECTVKKKEIKFLDTIFFLLFKLFGGRYSLKLIDNRLFLVNGSVKMIEKLVHLKFTTLDSCTHLLIVQDLLPLLTLSKKLHLFLKYFYNHFLYFLSKRTSGEN